MIESDIKTFFLKLLDKCNKANNIVITSHSNCDMDGFASILGMYFILTKTKAEFENKITIVCPSLNTLSKKVVQEHNIEDFESSWPENIDLLILVDVLKIFMTDIPLDENEKSLIDIKEIFSIDHHNIPNKSLETLLREVPRTELILSNYTSTCEIITDIIKFLLEQNEYSLKYHDLQQSDLNILLIKGIITDTGFFQHAENETFEFVNFLLNSDTSLKIGDIKNSLTIEESRPEKIACLRAAMRIDKLFFINEWVFVITYVSSFGASAAKRLIRLGASVSFVASFSKKNKKQFNISSRADQKLINNTEFDLSKILDEFAEKFKGSGGGHRGAAGCYGYTSKENNLDAIKYELIKLSKHYLEKGIN